MLQHPLAEVLGLEIDQDQAFARLYDRFRVEAGAPAHGKASLLAPYILPITNMDELLVSIEGVTETTAVTAAGGLKIFNPPNTERWNLRFVQIILDTGTYTWDEVTLHDGISAVRVVLSRPASVTETLIEFPGAGVKLDGRRSDAIRVVIDAFTGAGNLKVNAWVDVEKAY